MVMRLVGVETLKIGDRLGKSVFAESGRLLLAKNVKLSLQLIKKLKKHNLHYIYIEDALSVGIESREMIDTEVMLKSVNTVKNTMESLVKPAKKGAKQGVIPMASYEAVQSVVKSLIQSIEEHEDLLYTVTELMGTDMYTYKHSVNVAVLSILTARAMNYEPQVVEKIGMGALLHDIGKIQVNNELINKSTALEPDEFQEIKRHSAYGYEMIREDVILSSYTKQIIRLHHEKLDGSGYPLGNTEESIPEYVRIVTICDMFDAMTTDRAYRQRMPIYKALEILMTEGVSKIDASIYARFIENICIYPPGTGVRLSDGREGLVIDYRSLYPSRPRVRVIKNGVIDGEVDLMETLTLFVDEVIEVEH